MKDIYLIYMHVKPYVRKYLTLHFPTIRHNGLQVVTITNDKPLRKLFLQGLTRQQQETQAVAFRTCRIAVRVSADTFQRHGTHLTAQAEARINNILENRCKNFLLAYISVIYLFTGNLAQAINIFYDKTGYNEDIWPAESIRKIWQRETTIPKQTFINELIEHFSTFIQKKLSHD